MTDDHAAGSPVSHDLHRYLQQSRDALLGALDGLDEYDVRRPLTPTGTNLLGLVKHVAGVELDYLGNCVGRPSPVPLPWVEDGSIWEGADLWATAEQSRQEIVDLYHAAWRHSDESIAELDLATPAHVSWWRPERRDTTFGELLVR